MGDEGITVSAGEKILGIRPDIRCSSCTKAGAYKWGSCPFCGSRYPTRALEPVSLRIAAMSDVAIERYGYEMPRTNGQVKDYTMRLASQEIANLRRDGDDEEE